MSADTQLIVKLYEDIAITISEIGYFIFELYRIFRCLTNRVPLFVVVKELAFMTLRYVCEGEVRVREDLIILFGVVESCAVAPVCVRGRRENAILCLTDCLHNGTATRRRFVNTYCTGLGQRVVPRLRELAPCGQRESGGGIHQSFAQPCRLISDTSYLR